MVKINIDLIADFYELTMANGYFDSGMKDTIVYFDVFFRKIPDGGGFVIMAGIEQFIEYIENLKFSDEDIDFLREQKMFDENFLKYLKNFKFECDVWAVKEGTPVFPTEPIVTVKGPAIQAQLIETLLLLCINHQSLIATKTNRIVRAASGRRVMEFGARRAQGVEAAVHGARAAYIGGAYGTSCSAAAQMFNIPALGTMAHSWVQMFDSELEAFKVYARKYPQNCLLLIDTYNVLNSGMKNAIKVFKEEIITRGYRPLGVRIDSGDITYLSCKIRKILDDEGFKDAKICVSNSLDEYIIRDMIMQGAKVDVFGVGERLITASSDPILGCVYKLAAVRGKDDSVIPKIKISENVSKINIPGVKKVFRLFDKETSKAVADVITEDSEIIDTSTTYEIFDPKYTWKKKVLKNFLSVDIREQIFKNGKRFTSKRTLPQIQDFCRSGIDTLWDEIKRFENPHGYYVDLSSKLWNMQNEMIDKLSCSLL